MSRIKSIFLVLLLTAVVGIVPLAQAQTVELTLAGSSGAWQTLGVGAYFYCETGGVTCYHWTSASNAVNLTDNRVTPANNDGGTLVGGLERRQRKRLQGVV